MMLIRRPYVARFDEISGAFVLRIEDIENTGCALPDTVSALSFERA